MKRIKIKNKNKKIKKLRNKNPNSVARLVSLDFILAMKNIMICLKGGRKYNT